MDILTNSTSVDTACDLNLNNVDEDKKIKPKSIQATDRQAGDARIVITNRRTVMANSGLNEDVKCKKKFPVFNFLIIVKM